MSPNKARKLHRAQFSHWVLHAGEWMGETLTLSMEGQQTEGAPYPWGRSTDPLFQQLLSATFHKVLQVPLPNWGSVRNSLTVWRRTATTVIDGDRYAHIPPAERVELLMAAPSTRHLLREGVGADDDDDDGEE